MSSGLDVMGQKQASQPCSWLARQQRPRATTSPPPEPSPVKGEGSGGGHAILEKTRFLKRALDDGFGVDVQPVLQDGAVQAAEIQSGRQVPLRQVFRFAGWILAVLPTLHRVAQHKGRAARAVVGARAVIAHPPPEFSEQE